MKTVPRPNLPESLLARIRRVHTGPVKDRRPEMRRLWADGIRGVVSLAQTMYAFHAPIAEKSVPPGTDADSDPEHKATFRAQIQAELLMHLLSIFHPLLLEGAPPEVLALLDGEQGPPCDPEQGDADVTQQS